MALRCSVFGHDYGEAEVEREREERGSEVVLTVQEYEECIRCGDRTVISENTEVTSLSTETDEQPEGDPDEEFDVPADEHEDPVTDDGVILEDDGPSPEGERERGEWPESDDVGPPVETERPAEWPDDEDVASDDGDAGTDPAATGRTDDGIVLEDDDDLEDDPGESAAAADARTVTAEPPRPSDARDATPGSDDTVDSGTGIERAGSAPTPGNGGPGREEVPVEFYCPRCDYVASGDRDSLRAGDICPECRKGYLGQRERR